MQFSFKRKFALFSFLLLTCIVSYGSADIAGRFQRPTGADLEKAKQAYIAKRKERANKQIAQKQSLPTTKQEVKQQKVKGTKEGHCHHKHHDSSHKEKPQKRIVACEVITKKLRADDAKVNSLECKNDLTVGGNLTVGGDLNVAGTVSATDVSANTIDAQSANFDLETANVSYEDVNVIEDLREWQTERFVTPNYDRFPEGALPQTTKIGLGETYDFTSLSPFNVPVIGNDWNAIIHGIINFNSASDKEKLNFYSGAENRLRTLMVDKPFSATESNLKVGYLSGFGVTLNSSVMPQDQQTYAADAMGVILDGLNSINPDNLTAADRVTLFNAITLAKFYIIAWNSGNTLTNLIGIEYFGDPNPANLANYLYASAFYPNGFLNVTQIPAFGISDDGEALLPYARALPGLYKLFPSFLQSQIDTAIAGLQQGYYPHVLRNRPYSSKGQSTFGEVGYGYEPYITALVNADNFPTNDDPRTIAVSDYDVLLAASFEDQLDENLIFGPNFSVTGLNPFYFLDMLVEQGVMSQTEADYIQEEARIAYDAAIKPALLNFINTLYIDENSPLVRALRLTRYDDFPGEWGYKYLVNDQGFVQGLVNNGPYSGQTVFIDALSQNVVVYDINGTPIVVSLQDITLQRDEAAGDEQYTNMSEIVLRLNRDTPIPFYKKVSNSGPTPFDNWQVDFDNSSAKLPEKLHVAGESLLEFFTEAIDFYLNQWVTDSFPPIGQPKIWQDFFATREEAIAAINQAGRFTGDLEDPQNGGIYAFVQHYKPLEDNLGPLYDFAQVEAYYTDTWDGTPLLKLTNTGRIDGPPILDRDGNVLYDPQAPLGPDGLINAEALFAASVVDQDKYEYYTFLSKTEITGGKSARLYYFFYDFVKHSYENYLSMGANPLLNHYFSPYIRNTFEKQMAHTFSNSSFASGSNFNPISNIITYTHLMNFLDPHHENLAVRTTLLHEFIMGHALQIPLIQMLNTTGAQSWIGGAIQNPATAEGWAVFIETFFGPTYTSYLSKTDRYCNYIDPTGKPDPTVLVPSITNTARVAARLKWDTGIHFSTYKASLAEYAQGFREDTFNAFPMTEEVAQRVPVGPTQGLNYGLGFLQIIGLFQQLPTVLGQARYDELQQNGNKATKYFFDLILLDAAGYFISSLQPIYDEWAVRVRDRIAPFDDCNYEGYPVDAFPVHSQPYTGGNPSAYEFTDNPYVPGGFTFTFPTCPIPNDGVTCPHANAICP